MDDTLEIVAVFHLHEDDIAALALGDNIFLEDAATAGRADDALQVG